MNDMHSLGRLIADAQIRNGWSLRDLADRAEREGYDMSHTSFARLKSSPVASIKGENITMLSLVLKVPVAHVATAALESMGVHLGAAQPSLLDVVQESPDLSEYDQELLSTLLRVMLDRRRTDAHGHDHEEQPDAREREEPDGSAPARGGGARGSDARSGQKTTVTAGAPDALDGVRPADLDLAAHPNFELTRDRQDREWGDVGEESQDPGDEAGA